MNLYDFTYLIEKIEKAEYETEPFKHIYIENFFSSQHLDEILSSTEISSPKGLSDGDFKNFHQKHNPY
jgi:hypothetical protein